MKNLIPDRLTCPQPERYILKLALDLLPMHLLLQLCKTGRSRTDLKKYAPGRPTQFCSRKWHWLYGGDLLQRNEQVTLTSLYGPWKQPIKERCQTRRNETKQKQDTRQTRATTGRPRNTTTRNRKRRNGTKAAAPTAKPQGDRSSSSQSFHYTVYSEPNVKQFKITVRMSKRTSKSRPTESDMFLSKLFRWEAHDHIGSRC